VAPVTRLADPIEIAERPNVEEPPHDRPAPSQHPVQSARVTHRHLAPVTLVALVVPLLFVGLGAAWFLSSRPEPSNVAQTAAQTVAPIPPNELSPRPRLSVVVLPFKNLSDDPKDDYLSRDS
jgi:hypothetical protein